MGIVIQNSFIEIVKKNFDKKKSCKKTSQTLKWEKKPHHKSIGQLYASSTCLIRQHC